MLVRGMSDYVFAMLFFTVARHTLESVKGGGQFKSSSLERIYAIGIQQSVSPSSFLPSFFFYHKSHSIQVDKDCMKDHPF